MLLIDWNFRLLIIGYVIDYVSHVIDLIAHVRDMARHMDPVFPPGCQALRYVSHRGHEEEPIYKKLKEVTGLWLSVLEETCP